MTIKPRWDAKSAGEYERSLTLRDIKVEDDDDIQVYKKPWVGLTVMEAVELDIATNHPREFAAAIEAKLKEKNT